MSAHMRKPPTKEGPKNNIVHIIFHGKDYYVPEKVLAPYCTQTTSEKLTVTSTQVFSKLEHAHTKPGLLLKGLRAKENLSQVDFAKK